MIFYRTLIFGKVICCFSWPNTQLSPPLHEVLSLTTVNDYLSYMYLRNANWPYSHWVIMTELMLFKEQSWRHVIVYTELLAPFSSLLFQFHSYTRSTKNCTKEIKLPRYCISTELFDLRDSEIRLAIMARHLLLSSSHSYSFSSISPSLSHFLSCRPSLRPSRVCKSISAMGLRNVSNINCSSPIRSFTTNSSANGNGNSTEVSHSPLSKIRSKHQFEEVKLIEYLKSKRVLTTQDSNFIFNQFSHGQSNPTFVLEYDVTSEGGKVLKKKIVIRKQPPGNLLKGRNAILCPIFILIISSVISITCIAIAAI